MMIGQKMWIFYYWPILNIFRFLLRLYFLIDYIKLTSLPSPLGQMLFAGIPLLASKICPKSNGNGGVF